LLHVDYSLLRYSKCSTYMCFEERNYGFIQVAIYVHTHAGQVCRHSRHTYIHMYRPRHQTQRPWGPKSSRWNTITHTYIHTYIQAKSTDTAPLEAKISALEHEVNAVRTSRFEAEREASKLQDQVHDLESEVDHLKRTINQV
jgi:hypothetical protein